MTDLLISGYASRFDERDLGGDTIRRGAFAASLLERPAPRPMLYRHDTDTPVGVWTRVVEDAVGLFVEGRLQAGTALADRIIALVASGSVDGLSIGYRTMRSRPQEGGRELLELDLWEVSIVAFPMLPTARIDAAVRDDNNTQPTQTAERIAA